MVVVAPQLAAEAPSQVAGNATEPAVAASQQDCASLVVSSANCSGIAGRLVDGDGRPLGAEFTVSATGDSPDVTYNDDDDEYLVVWSEWNGDQTTKTIHVRRVTGNARLAGSERTISAPDAQYRDKTPSVAWNGFNDQYLVSWAHTFFEFPTVRVLVQRLAASGAEIGADDFLLDNTEYNANNDIAVDHSTGQWLVVWEINAEAPFSFIHGKFVSANGTVGSVIEVSARDGEGTSDPFGNGYADTPVVAFNPDDGEYLVAWSDPNNRGAHDPTGLRMLLGQRVSTSGALIGSRSLCDLRPGRSDDPRNDYDTRHSETRVRSALRKRPPRRRAVPRRLRLRRRRPAAALGGRRCVRSVDAAGAVVLGSGERVPVRLAVHGSGGGYADHVRLDRAVRERPVSSRRFRRLRMIGVMGVT